MGFRRARTVWVGGQLYSGRCHCGWLRRVAGRRFDMLIPVKPEKIEDGAQGGGGLPRRRLEGWRG